MTVSSSATSTKAENADIAALAKGGRTNFLGFVIRLVARIPFLFIAGRLYGAENVGRFASATIAVELAAQLATLGQKRGLAQQLAKEEGHASSVVADALLLSVCVSALFVVLLWLVPVAMFPSGYYTGIERLLLPLAILPLALCEVALAALAYRFDVAATVRARAVVEPWTLSIAGGVFWLAGLWWKPFLDSGLILSYGLSTLAAMVTALLALYKSYRLPRHWQPRPGELFRLAWHNLPLAGADAIEWGTRKLDLFILGTFAPAAAVGVYFVAQQIATLPQKLKTSFEPVLGPVITRNLRENNLGAIARQVSQVGFWIVAAQAGIALALGMPARGVIGVFGPNFVMGTGALAMLLAGEVVASPAVVSEAALIYMARMRNLWIGLAMLGLQGLLTVAFILLAREMGWGEAYETLGAATALTVSLGLTSVLKGRLLGRLLGHGVSTWRWALVWAAVPAVIVGILARYVPEWVELSFGVAAILGVYFLVIWRMGFGPEDRVLFSKQKKA